MPHSSEKASIPVRDEIHIDKFKAYQPYSLAFAGTVTEETAWPDQWSIGFGSLPPCFTAKLPPHRAERRAGRCQVLQRVGLDPWVESGPACPAMPVSAV